MMRSGVRMADHKPTSLLSQEENDVVFSLLGSRCQTLATTVVELYTTGGPHSDEWQLRHTGVLCLVKDNGRRSYFFRLYCPIRKAMLWEHEVYNDMDYLAPASFFHTFEAEDCITGFNFAHEAEGKCLRDVLLEKLKAKRLRRDEKRRRNMNNSASAPRPQPQMNGMSTVNNTGFPPPVGNRNRKEQKKRLTKADIGTPQNFRHVSHVGWDPNKGFDYENVNNPHLKEFFDKAGVSESQLQDFDTRQFIYDFIERNGGLEAVEGDLKPPPVPTRTRPPPPPPSRAPPALPAHPPPPPPPPPIRTLPPRNPLSNTSSSNSSSATVVSIGSSTSEVPSPPPPPPPMSPISPPPPPSPAPEPDDSRSALLQAIRSQPQLKPVSAAPPAEKKMPDRGDLLCQIRQGVELKSVSSTPAPTNKSPDNGLAGALARALERRNMAIHSDTSGSSDTEDDDEWED